MAEAMVEATVELVEEAMVSATAVVAIGGG